MALYLIKESKQRFISITKNHKMELPFLDLFAIGRFLSSRVHYNVNVCDKILCVKAKNVNVIGEI